MEFIILSFFTALGKMIVLSRFMGLPRMIRHAKWLDLGFLIIGPILFWGTFSGAITAAFSALWFTGMLFFISLFIKPTQKEYKL